MEERTGSDSFLLPLQPLVIWVLTGESASIQQSRKFLLGLAMSSETLAGSLACSVGCVFLLGTSGAPRVVELGLLTSFWVPVGCEVFYRNRGPLLHQEMLMLWAERCAQGGSCSDFCRIPRWAGQGEAVSSSMEGAAASRLRLRQETNKEMI